MLRRQTGVQEQVVAIRSFGADEKNTAICFFLQNFNNHLIPEVLMLLLASLFVLILLDVYPQTNCKPSVKYLLSGHGTSKYCPVCFD